MNRTRKYIILILTLLTALLCAAGASTWIIATPTRLTPTWDKGKNPVWVNRYAEFDYDPNGIPLSSLEGKITFCDENGELLTTSEVAEIKLGNAIANLSVKADGEAADVPKGGAIKVGSTYQVSEINITLNENYILVGTFHGSTEGKVTSNDFYHQTGDGYYAVDSFLLKYKTVYQGTPSEKNNPTYYTIEDALSTLSGTISIEAGETSFTGLADTITGYAGSGRTVSSGKTLLVPRIATDNGSPRVVNDGTKVAYATLHIPKGVTLTVNGTLTVNASRTSTGGSTSTVQAHGCMEVEKDAHVEIASGATWYSMGYSYGAGDVNVQSGATVYEPFSMIGWKGGTISAGIRATVFPLNQFVLSSIICKTKFNAGSLYKVLASFQASNVDFDPEVTFVSNSNSSFLQLTSGTITKWIDEASGKIHFQSDGTLTFNNIAISFRIGISVTVSTNNLQVPLPGFFAITLNSGTATIPSGVQLKLLPGAALNINSNATLRISGGAYAYGKENVTLTDVSSWKDGNNGKDYPVSMTDTQGKSIIYRVLPTLDFTNMSSAPVTNGGKMIVDRNAKIGAQLDGIEGGQITFNNGASISGNSIKEDLSTSSDSGLGDAFTGGGGIFFTSTFTTKGPILNEEGTAAPISEFSGNSVWMFTKSGEIGGWKQASSDNSITFKVKYDAKEGAFANGSNTLEEEMSMFVDNVADGARLETMSPSEMPVREFYSLENWYYIQGGKQYTLEDQPLTVHNGEEIVLYAGWKAVEYDIIAAVVPSDITLSEILDPDAEKPLYSVMGQWKAHDELRDLNSYFAKMQELLSDYSAGYKLIEKWYLAASLTDVSGAREISELTATTLRGADLTFGIIIFCQAAPTITFDVQYIGEGGYENEFSTLWKTVSKPDFTGTFGDLLPEGNFTGHDDDVEKQYYFDGWYIRRASGDTKVVEGNTVTISDLTQADGKYTLTLVAKWAQKASITVNLTDNYASKSGIFTYYAAIAYTIQIGEHNKSDNVAGTDKENKTGTFTHTYYLHGEQLTNWSISITVSGGYTGWGASDARGTYVANSDSNTLQEGGTYTFTATLSVGTANGTSLSWEGTSLSHS